MASSFISSSPFTQYHPSSFQIPTSTVTMPYFTITTTFSNFPAPVTGGLTSTCHRIPAMVSTDHCLMCSIGACTTQRLSMKQLSTATIPFANSKPHCSLKGGSIFSADQENQDMKEVAGTVLMDNCHQLGHEKTQNLITIKGIIGLIMSQIDESGNGHKEVISLGMGDPTVHSCFSTTHLAQEAVEKSLSSGSFNGYAPTVGLPQTRKAIADYLSRDLPYKLQKDDVFVTSGCTNAIDIALSILARPGANVLLPRPGFPIYELCSAFRQLETRHYDLLSHKDWEVDLDAVEALADDKTAAIVIINPGNPCGNVYSYQHLLQIAETAKKLGILVIADEVYGHLAFGKTPFLPMGTFGSIAPVFTLGSLSKRWLVPGWRLGWLAITDPNGTFKHPKIMERLKKYFDIYGGPPTFIQASVPSILEKTDKLFFNKTINILKQTAHLCFEGINNIPCLTCPQKPEGSMAVMVKLELSRLRDITDDIDFCFKLAKEESVVILPGVAVGMKNWLRVTFAVEPTSLEEALKRIKSFYQRHAYQPILQENIPLVMDHQHRQTHENCVRNEVLPPN